MDKIKDLMLQVKESKAAHAKAEGDAAFMKTNFDIFLKQLVESQRAMKKMVESHNALQDKAAKMEKQISAHGDEL